MDIRHLMSALELTEKIALVSGRDHWHTVSVPRLNIPAIMLADGPHGLRKQQEGGDHLGIGQSEPATCFPPAATSANSWDPELLHAMGKAIGKEAVEQGVAVVLGPGINIKRSPLCGRNFEYFSEDPYLTGQLACAWVEGIQTVGVGASLKHFAGNNQEKWRMLNDSLIDPRALREIYLAAFEYVVKQAKPWTLMAAYNKLNGVYCCENQELLSSILREEWGFAGTVISDWAAVNDPVLALKAGLDLEMPASSGVSAKKIEEALTTGQLTEAQLNEAVRNVLALVLKAQESKEIETPVDLEQHHELARKVATESAVLLKNEGQLLPLKPEQKIAICGALAQNPRYQGTGSSQVNPTQIAIPLDYFQALGSNYKFRRGYTANADELNEGLLVEACYAAEKADVAVVFAGLTPEYESEGYDRTHLSLPPSHDELIRRVAGVNPNTVVVLQGGSPVAMPWLDQVKGVLHLYLSGQAGGAAVVDLLYGIHNPTGKLAESYPLTLEDCPSTAFFASDRTKTEYRESIFVGYRYYDAAEKEVLFPFGYGLSYTKFSFADLTILPGNKLQCTLTNKGDRLGAEVVQVYVGKSHSPLFRARRELAGFKKVWLQPGESKKLEFTLTERAFSYYNPLTKAWQIEEGCYEISVGSSSRDLPLQGYIELESAQKDHKTPDYQDQASAYYLLKTSVWAVTDQEFQAIYGRELPANDLNGRPFNANTTLADLQATWIGRQVSKQVKRYLGTIIGVEDQRDPLWQMAWNSLYEMPLRAIVPFSEGEVPPYLIQALLAWANGSYGQAFKHIWQGE